MVKLIQSVLLIALYYSSIAYAVPWVLNNPYPESEANQNIYYTSFSEQPKTLDPAKSYSSNEYQFIAQIYEPVLQYDYLKRPYTLIPATAEKMPEVHYIGKAGQEILSQEAEDISRTIYTIHIRANIFYQPHPAFAKDKNGTYRYHHLPEDFLDEQNINELSDFKHTSTRELTADDYIYGIKRLANPATNSPIYGLMSEHIVGFAAFSQQLDVKSSNKKDVDLRRFTMEGLKKIDDYSFEITLNGVYPQFVFWLAMPFFSPIPWEADVFYSQPDMKDRNLDFSWYPVGTGPFMMEENNPNSRMVLQKNPNYHEDFFPSGEQVKNVEKSYLHHVGQRLPLIDKAVYVLEKEAIPRWNKFLQGYYDLSGVGTDSFDQAIQISRSGNAALTLDMRNKGMKLNQMTDPSIYYLGFNMLDPVLGGKSMRARKLRQAISIAVNYDENIAIFFNGRGLAAQGPIPPGIFGHLEGEKGVNPYVYQWVNDGLKRRPIVDALSLMREAGYPGGMNPVTHRSLILNYDVPSTGGPDDKSQLNWMRKQFARIGISLNVRATQYNRFQEKMRSGNAQIFSWGWNADYPDPENFLFLLYGPNGKVRHGGENASNYQNAVFDRLFEKMKNQPNGKDRQKLINQMVEIVRKDAPWSWGINTQSLALSQQWMAPFNPNTISQNTLKYMAIDVPLRNQLRSLWNQPRILPIVLFFLFLSALLLPYLWAYFHLQRLKANRAKL